MSELCRAVSVIDPEHPPSVIEAGNPPRSEQPALARVSGNGGPAALDRRVALLRLRQVRTGGAPNDLPSTAQVASSSAVATTAIGRV